jgi:putative aldouronate transport system substrate-binding protein
MKKRISLVLVLALSVFLVLSACTSGKSPSGNNSDSTNTTDAKPETPSNNNEGTNEGATASEYPEYLNLDSAYPVIKDEFAGQYKPKLVIVQDSSAGKWEDLWISRYLKDKYNMEFEVESILNTALSERKSLMFGAGELPDIMMNMALSTTEVFKYGQLEGQLLKCDEYINETLTPNIYAVLQNREDAKAFATTPDGHIYSLPMANQLDDEGAYPRIFVNRKWLDSLGIDMPRTLDEFTDMLYEVKEKDPAGVGSENVFPLGGGDEAVSNSFYLLTALGYVTADPYGASVCLRNGEVVIPAYDIEVYKEFLRIMNQYYKDGIINKNYYTLEQTEAIAQLNGGQTAVYRDPVYVTGLPTWNEWEALYPLTSEWTSEPVWLKPNAVRIGNLAFSADTEYPELCMRFADIYYNYTTDDCRALWIGPGADSEYNYDYVNAHWDHETETEDWDSSGFPEGVDLWTYLMQYLTGFMPQFGAFEDRPARDQHAKMLGGENPAEKKFNLENPDYHYRASVYSNIVPYGVEGFPTIYYVDEETDTAITDLETLIVPYIKEQVSLFVTGERPLDQVEAFAEELKGMGIEDLLSIYKDVYDTYKATLE